MAKEIKWTKTATRDFERIITYLRENWTQQVALNFISRTFSLLDLLSKHPELAPIQVAEKQIHGILITKHNKLFFRIKLNRLIVLKIFDTRMKPSKLKLR
jgi:plasmid stabilization system protein ParE